MDGIQVCTYTKFMPAHSTRVYFAIDDLPLGIDFSLSQSASFSQTSEPPDRRQNTPDTTPQPRSLVDPTQQKSSGSNKLKYQHV